MVRIMLLAWRDSDDHRWSSSVVFPVLTEQRRNSSAGMRLIATAAWCSSPMIGDHLGVNEWHGSQYWSLVQLTGLLRSHEVGAGRRGCCTDLLYSAVRLS